MKKLTIKKIKITEIKIKIKYIRCVYKHKMKTNTIDKIAHSKIFKEKQ